MPALRKVPERFLRQARPGEITTEQTRRGSQRRFAVDIVRAERGEIHRRNTVPGTPERQAVDKVSFERRKARQAEGESVREALGHRRAGSPRPRAVLYGHRDGTPILLYDAEFSRRDLRRAARHLSLVGQLTEGRLSPASFRARVRHWHPVAVLGPHEVAGEYKFLSDPEAVLALAEQVRGEEPEWIRYPNAALRRRRVR